MSEAARPAGPVEVWAARAWNVFNEGRPFSIVYPLLVLLAAAPLGLAPDGSLGLALLGAGACALVLSRFSFPLRGRALLWLAALAALPLLEPWRAPALLAGALAGYAFFTVVVWGSVYYHLRTGAPWTNGLRFWRLVLTNSDPTSGNALEQMPKLLIALERGRRCWRSSRARGVAARIAAAVAIAAGLGALACASFARALPRYPEPGAGRSRARRGARRARLRDRRRRLQPRPPVAGGRPVMDRLAREGTEYLGVEPAYPARTVVCFSSMLTGATPAEHGMRSNFAPRLGVRRESVFDVLDRHGRRGRLVGIAHLLDPFGEEVVRSVTSVQPTSQIDHSLAAEGRRVVEEEDPDLLVLQLLAADQLGHVRGVRSPEYLDQLAETDRRVGELPRVPRGARQARRRHRDPDGRPRPGPRDRRPRPSRLGRAAGAVRRLGRGRAAGRISREPRSVLELAATIAALLGVPSAGGGARPAARARGGPARGAGARARARRALPRHRGRARRGAGRRRRACRHPGDGLWACRWTSCSWTTARAMARASIGARARRRVHLARRLARPRRRASHGPRDRPRRGLRRRRVPRRRRRVRPGRPRACPRAGRTRTRRLRARLALPRPARGHVLAPHPRQPLDQRAARHAASAPSRATPRPATARSRPARSPPRASGTTTTTRRCSRSRCGAPASTPVEVPIRYRRRDERALVRALPGVPRARGARRLAPVARRASLAQDQEQHGRDPRAREPERPAAAAARTAGTASVSGPNGASGRRPRASRRPSARRRRATPTPPR